jgi:bacterioferritin-associated ferredoxin
MYVCVCHAVTEGDVRDKVAAGATTPKAVRTACGMRPGCGACVRRIRALLDDWDAGIAERAADRLDLGGVEHAPAA